MMIGSEDMLDSFIVITNEGNKKKILRELSRNKLLYNLKFKTFKELKKKLFFDYDNRALEYVVKNYNVNLKVAKVYLDNLFFLKDLDNDKVKFLNKLKRELLDNDLLIQDLSFKDYISNKKIVVYGYDKLTREQELILKEINGNVEFKNSGNNSFKPVVYEATNMQEEVRFVVYKISELLYKGINTNKIKVIINDDYINTVKRYFRIYDIPINMKSRSSFFSTVLAQDFLSNYEKYSIQENIDILRDKYSNVNELVKIINKSVLVKDKEIRKEFIINDLKNTKITAMVYDSAVQVSDIEEYFDFDDYVFLMGFNINFYPKVRKDEDYLSDNIKEELGIDTSILNNNLQKNILIEKIQSIHNLVITYKLRSSSGLFYPSLLIKDMNLEVRNVDIDNSLSYSLLDSKLEYARDLDNLFKFNVVSDNLIRYRNSLNIDYREYSNLFTGINKEVFRERLGKELVISYTNMEMYNECAFKYYLTKVLNVNLFQESFKTIIGNITHHILEFGLNRDIDIKFEIMKFIKEQDYTLNAREYFYLEKLVLELEKILHVIKEQDKRTKLKQRLFESEFFVYKDRDNVNVTFKGLIDKVMYEEVMGHEVIAVVDYKTGNTKILLDYLEEGLYLQLPIYLYLLRNSERFKDAVIAGFYIQRVLNSVPNVEENKTIEGMRKDSLRLLGYSNSDGNVLELLDDNFREDSYIKDLKIKSNGEFSKSAKILSSKEMDNLTNEIDILIDKCIDNILDAQFKINPKIIKDKNIACTYCGFKDICFKTKKDEEVIGGDVNEMDRGTE